MTRAPAMSRSGSGSGFRLTKNGGSWMYVDLSLKL
jgi:hypothetical protein